MRAALPWNFAFRCCKGLMVYIGQAPPPEDPPFFVVTGIALPVSGNIIISLSRDLSSWAINRAGHCCYLPVCWLLSRLSATGRWGGKGCLVEGLLRFLWGNSSTRFSQKRLESFFFVFNLAAVLYYFSFAIYYMENIRNLRLIRKVFFRSILKTSLLLG